MSSLSFTFAHPLFFLLWVVPFSFLFLKWARKTDGALSVSSAASFEGISGIKRWLYQYLAVFLFWVAWLFLVVALARPQIVNTIKEVKGEGVDIMLSVDTSGSMKALDLLWEGERVNRLEVIKKVISSFASKRLNDRIGIVVFGDDAYTQSVLTTDRKLIASYLDMLTIGMAGDGTAIGNGLAIAVKRLTTQKTKSKIIILLTDGRSNSGNVIPEVATDLAIQYKIKVYTIGVGSDGPVPFPEDTPLGPRIVRMELDLDEELLTDIANRTGGKYFRAKDSMELQSIYDEIDALEKTEIKTTEYREIDELYMVPLTLGFLLLAGSLISRHLVFRVYP